MSLTIQIRTGPEQCIYVCAASVGVCVGRWPGAQTGNGGRAVSKEGGPSECASFYIIMPASVVLVCGFLNEPFPPIFQGLFSCIGG
jgi:hypothetical protein